MNCRACLPNKQAFHCWGSNSNVLWVTCSSSHKHESCTLRFHIRTKTAALTYTHAQPHKKIVPCFPFTCMLLDITLCTNVLPPKLIYNLVCHPLYSRYVLYYMLLKQHSYIGCEFFSTNFQTTAYKICARYVQISCNDVNEKWHQIPYITLKHFGTARYELHATKICSMHIAVSRKCTQCIFLLWTEYMLHAPF